MKTAENNLRSSFLSLLSLVSLPSLSLTNLSLKQALRS